jgi:hypothetical protein
MVATEMSIDEDNFKSSHSNMLSEQEDIDLEGFQVHWIQGVREQVKFLNSSMKHHCILFKVQRREFVIGGTP